MIRTCMAVGCDYYEFELLAARSYGMESDRRDVVAAMLATLVLAIVAGDMSVRRCGTACDGRSGVRNQPCGQQVSGQPNAVST